MPKRMLLLLIALLALCVPAAAEDIRYADSPSAFRSTFEFLADGIRESFTIETSAKVAEQAMRSETGGWQEFCGSCGILGYSTVTRETGGQVSIRFEQIRYYSGKRIWAAMAAGMTDRLTARERDTLRAAADIAAGVRGSETERERALHDWLCSHVRYSTDDEENDNDCAVGALLDGLADCDGYSDAFFLLCRLSGIDARLVDGTATDFRGQNDSGHMWNAVCIRGTWVMVDVTWDDQDDGISYLYYNIGADRLRRNHRWSADVLSFVPEARDRSDLRGEALPLVEASDGERLADALRPAAADASSSLVAVLGGSLGMDHLTAALRRNGAFTWYTRTSPGAVEVTGISWLSDFRYVTGEQEAIDWINSFAGSAAPPEEIALMFSPALGRQLYADNYDGVERLLYSTRLTAPVSWSYSTDDYRVFVRNPVWGNSLPVLRSAADLPAWFRSALAVQPKSLSFMTGGNLTREQMKSMLGELLYRNGVASFDGWYHFGGVRVLVTGITYEDEYRVVSSVTEAEAYLRDCRMRGVTVCRLYCSDALYARLMADEGSGVFALMRDTGWASRGFRYTDAYRMLLFGT